MINFTSKPAFGFEISIYNAEQWYKKTHKEAIQRKKAELNISHQGKFDDNEYEKSMEDLYNKMAKSAWKTANLEKVLGYAPISGTLMGLIRISKTANFTKEEMPNKLNHIVRGCIELFSLGILLLIPDLILTGYRIYHVRNPNSPVA